MTVRSGDRREAAYLDELERLLAEAGTVIADGLTEAAVDSMREILTDVRDLDVPASLARVVLPVDRALTAYVRVAEVLHEANHAMGEDHQALLHQAALLRHGAARRYDEARTVLADARR